VNITPIHLFMIMDTALFVVGLITFFIGAGILAFRSAGADVRTLAAQTTRLVQKGIAEQVPGLVGNASTLLDSLNQLVGTVRGVGIFLCMAGMAMMAISCWLAIQIYQVSP
jgi:hypothetical protein